MKQIVTVADCEGMRLACHGKTIGFVPTMGHLHAGHAALISQSLCDNAVTVVSSFVNPTQFNATQDFDQYPRTDEADRAVCERLGVDYFFQPLAEDLYADDYAYRVNERALSMVMEGVHRPGHFEGVLTVLLKLFMLVQPARVYFGEKDYQQLMMVRGMVQAFFLPIEVVACPTVRDGNGLALSSRNSRLSADQHLIAHRFHHAMLCRDSDPVVSDVLSKAGFRVEYIETYRGRRYGAVWLGDVRLIDNVVAE